MQPPRRVITGLDPQGRSCILFDDAAGSVIWSTDQSPADNSSSADAGLAAFTLPAVGTLFIYSDFEPGFDFPLHATDTIDYMIVISGAVTFVTEAGETVLRAGDVLVDRGILHGWRNDFEEPCRVMSILCASCPVGKGATMSGTVSADDVSAESVRS